ncbi:MAG: putative glycoside hydrolase [Patescibacteria group bacterium]|nr:putative glycoside hydrolase [Patescibacteria group bacterium]
MHHRKILLTFLFLAVLMIGGFLASTKAAWAGTGKIVGDKYNLPYPRIGVFLWAGTTEWFAQKGIDLVAASPGVDIEGVKKLSPKVLVSHTNDINKLCGDDRPEEWYYHDADGNRVSYWGGYLCNFNYQPFREFVGNTFAGMVGGADFVTTDGLWTMPGRAEILQTVRSRIGDTPFMVNGNGGYEQDKSMYEYYNGSFLEDGGNFNSNWDSAFGTYEDMMNYARQPHIIVIDGTPTNWSLPNMTDDFKLMRFGLGTTLLGDGYFSYEVGINNHFYIGYFDEYDLDLGYPKGAPQCIKNEGRWGYEKRCVFVRFFDKGVSILNVKGKSESISDNDLKSLPGYAGPYYRFRGGQDTVWNNGQLFTSLNLDGQKELTNEQYEHYKIWGDAIILLKEPKVVVADIIIDDHPLVTSPANKQTELKGAAWEIVKPGKGDKFWRLYSSELGESPASYGAISASKNAEAIFRPKIGVPGRYRVSEWHGNDYAESETTSAIYEINYKGGVKVESINQSQSYGQWNFLGEFYFTEGDSGYVKLNNNGQGVLVADAVKFEYQDAVLMADFNCDGQINIADFGILLSHWGQKENNGSLKKYKHPLCQEAKSLDLVLDNTINIKDLGALLSCWGNPDNETCYQ